LKKDKLELQLRQKQIEVMTRGLSKKLSAVFLSFTLMKVKIQFLNLLI